MTRMHWRLLASASLALGLQLVLIAAAPAALAAGASHSGRSMAVGLTGVSVLDPVVQVPDVILPAGVQLDPSGGLRASAAAHLALPANLGTVDVAKAAVEGGGDQSNAQTEVASLTLVHALPASLRVANGVSLLDAQVLTAHVAVSCGGLGDTAGHGTIPRAGGGPNRSATRGATTKTAIRPNNAKTGRLNQA